MPGSEVILDKLKLTVAGLVLLTAVTLKNLYPLSSELNPVPVSPCFWRPSTNISSSTVNGGVEKPNTGVTNVHVHNPAEAPVAVYTNLLTVDPLSLFTANISCVIDCNPLGGTTIFTLLKELLKTKAFNVAEPTSSLVIGLIIFKSGDEV